MDQIFLRFDPASVLSSAILPLSIAAVFLLFFIPSILAPGAKPAGVGKAIYCFAAQGLGIFLMSAGGIPAVSGVLQKFVLGVESYSTETYLALLLLFAAGGLIYLWHEQLADRIDAPSSVVPAILFWFTFKAVGLVLVIYSSLSLLLTMLLVKPLPGDWWVQFGVLFLYGLLLSWCTRMPKSESKGFHSSPMPAMHHHTLGKKKKGLSLAKLRRA